MLKKIGRGSKKHLVIVLWNFRIIGCYKGVSREGEMYLGWVI